MDINDRVVIVTGASSGIGAATARLAHARGAKVVLAARRAARLTELAQELPGSLAVPTDVTNPAALHSLVDRAVETFAAVDVLINNAGQGLHVPLESVGTEDFRAILDLNVVAPLVAMQAVIPTMRRQGAGAIVNVSSGTTRMVLPGVGAYAASKSALNMLSHVARAELAPDGIVVSLVHPSVTATEFHDVLRQGAPRRNAPFAAQPAAEVADVILGAVSSGAAEVVVPHTAAAT